MGRGVWRSWKKSSVRGTTDGKKHLVAYAPTSLGRVSLATKKEEKKALLVFGLKK